MVRVVDEEPGMQPKVAMPSRRLGKLRSHGIAA